MVGRTQFLHAFRFIILNQISHVQLVYTKNSDLVAIAKKLKELHMCTHMCSIKPPNHFSSPMECS